MRALRGFSHGAPDMDFSTRHFILYFIKVFCKKAAFHDMEASIGLEVPLGLKPLWKDLERNPLLNRGGPKMPYKTADLLIERWDHEG